MHEQEVRDALEEAMLHAVRSIRRSRERLPLSVWLARVAMDAALLRLRLASWRPDVDIADRLPAVDAAGRLVGPIPLPPGAGDSERVSACITALPLQYRAALILTDLEGLGIVDAANVLRVPEALVRRRRHHALLALAGSVVLPRPWVVADRRRPRRHPPDPGPRGRAWNPALRTASIICSMVTFAGS